MDLKEIVIAPGEGGVFDVTVNNKLAFSMDREGRFPTVDDIKPKVREAL